MFDGRSVLNYSYLSNDEKVIRQVASWIYYQWLSHKPEHSIESTIERIRPRAGSTEVPLCIVASDNGLPVGCASLTSSDMASHPELTPWLASVYVSDRARGKGIATELCTRIVAEAKRLGHQKLYLFTEDQMSLYGRMGWKIRGTENYRDLNVTIMEYSIS